MSTFNSARLRQSSSSSTFEPLDPTTLAISLIPLLPPHFARESSDHQPSSPITLPVLAASLSTLPHNVINAINFLAQELKSLREQQVLGGASSSHPQASASCGPDGGSPERENRERWLENQKVNHLKKSISSLSNLQSTLQSRLLTTVDTLSDLQQTHQRETQQLTDERDGVRAVNQVLKRKVATLEKQLRESKQVMDSVLEQVEVVNKGDWSIVEHGAIQVFSPLPPPSHCSEQSAGQDHSFLSEDLCTFHLQQCQGPNPSQIPHLLSPMVAQEGAALLSRSTGSETQRTNQRSITLIAELTEELESLRREIKVELKTKHGEISRLKSLIEYRDDEIRQLMARLQHFMGLDGFYVRPLSSEEEEDQTAATEPSSQTLNNPLADSEATPRQRSDRFQKGINPARGHLLNKGDGPGLESHPPTSEQRQMEEEIRQLEMQLKDITHSSQFASPMDDRSSRPTRVLDELGARSAAGNDRSSVTSANASDDQALSRVLGDLSNQVAELKAALKEVVRERDALRRLRVRKKPARSSTSSSETDLAESSAAPETTRSLATSLQRSKFECTRLTRLLAQSEARIRDLEAQIAEQESEFEKVAERVQDKLKDQRSKMLQAQMQIEQLQGELEEARGAERRAQDALGAERRRAAELAGVSGRRRKTKPSFERLDVPDQAHEPSEPPSSSAASAASGSSSKRRAPPKDPFN
ncbi:hypothetical protein PCANC_05375 [Puccinia coronata f. sp. avenae]|uniref:Uncharacterized protein n=1 Tax=Puccinia coronata f. sp. avenae TaxID=200324 RepID=A0A2N5VXF5_9BASI|nr:hypothetical protein PCASD_08281 [Puccinia coronata f. sp. avenae]PLW54646.1 hypothetical protein PCANC_05375 [Puccinia coronata f. sp. avenae]